MDRGLGFYQPALQGYLDAQSQVAQQGHQQMGMLAQLAQLQGQQQDRQMRQQMMPLQMQMLQAQVQAHQAQAAEQARKQQFFSPENQQQYVEGGKPAITLPEDVQGPVQGAQPGQMNFDKFLQSAAASGVVNPEVYANHQATQQMKLFQLHQQEWQIRQAMEQKNLDRTSREALAQQHNEVLTALGQMRNDTSASNAQLMAGTQRAVAQIGADSRLSAAQMSADARRDIAANRPAEPMESIVGPDGKPILVPRSKAEGKTPAPRAGDRPLSATAQKEIVAADQAVAGADQALGYLKQADDLNEKAIGFWGGGMAAKAGTLLPKNMRPEAIDASNTLDSLVKNSVMPQLKSIFGTNPTEGERKIMLELEGSLEQSPSVRGPIITRSITALEARKRFNEQRATQLREGSYFTPGGGGQPSPSPAPPGRVRKYNPETGKIE